MPKTEVYSWRLSPALKEALEAAAREEEKSLASLLEAVAEDWLAQARHGRDGDEARGQERMRSRALRFVGSFRGGDPQRAEQARERLRARLVARRP